MESQYAVKLIRSHTLVRPPHAMVVQEVKRLLGERDSSIAHISRNQNVVSHRLASFGPVEARTAIWIKFGPAN